MVKSIEIKVKNNCFEYCGKQYDCHMAIKKDTELILQEAETSHKDVFVTMFDRNSLEAYRVRLYLDNNGTPIFGMIIYTINIKEEDYKRLACGNYYPICFEKILMPHTYQASICW